MKVATQSLRASRISIAAGILALLCGHAFSAAAQGRNEKQQRLEDDRQACLSGQSGQTRDVCLKEAQAVFAERPDSTRPVSADQLQRNATQRCDALAGDERTACIARMRGEGTVTGSIRTGGVLRELVTTEAPPPPPQNQDSASSSR